MKRIISLIIAVAICITLGLTYAIVLGTNNMGENKGRSKIVNGVKYVDNLNVVLLEEKDAYVYDKFNLLESELLMKTDVKSISIAESILNISVMQSEEEINGTYAANYSSEELESYLPECEEIKTISKINSFVYVTYTTKTGEEVTLAYSQDGLDHKGIYTQEDDTYIYLSKDSAIRYENFRHGTYYEVTNKLQKEIQRALSRGDIDALYNNDAVIVIEDENGGIAIEPNLGDNLDWFTKISTDANYYTKSP